MNEELQVALASIIETTISAKDFVLEQAPDVIHQLLAWKLIESLFIFSITVALIATPIILLKKLGKHIVKDEDGKVKTNWFNEPEINSLPIFVLKIVFSALSLLVGLCFITDMPSLDWLQIWIAPKVYLLEYASSLVG